MSSKVKLLGVLLLTTAIAGCGSTKTGSIDPGPGPGPGPVDPVDPDPVDPDPVDPTPGAKSYQLQGHFARLNRSGGTIDSTTVSRGEMTATVAENRSSASVTAPAGIPGAANLPRTESEDGRETFEAAGGETFLTLYEGPSQMGGTHYQMGLYGNGDSGGVGIAGNRTSPEQITASGEYNGVAGGFVAVQGEEDVLAWGGMSHVSLTVDGTGAHVEGDIKHIYVDGVGSALAEVVLERTEVAGGAYDGVARLAPLSTSPGVVVTSDTGDYQGAFYGANAAETAGTFHASGTVSAFGKVDVIGGFGGSKD